MTSSSSVLFALSATALIACGAGDSTGSSGSNITASGTDNLFDQSAVCADKLKKHSGVRETDLKEGTIRWNCADVQGFDGRDRGQEYCEYHAVQDGKYVNEVSELDTSKKLSCYFTSVYADLDNQGGPGPRDKELATALSSEANFSSTFAPSQVRMVGRFNSRGAASALIRDCHGLEAVANEERQVACYQASVKNPAKAAELAKACKKVDLGVESNWKAAQKLGAEVYAAKDGASFETQRDIIGCLSAHRAGGVTTRNSDPLICGRVFRAAQECSCNWNDLPDALEGFLFTGWTSESMPPGCRRAIVDGQEDPQLTICDVTQSELEELSLDDNYNSNLSKFCNERYAKDIVMKAPIRAVEIEGSCKTDTAFCSTFKGN